MAPPCDGLRCPLGRCVPRGRLCDGLADCRDRSDEPKECNLLSGYTFCIQHDNPHTCVCGPTELRCKNGHCVPKSRYCNGMDDCGDGTDEPKDCGTCASFLRVIAPARICDGNRNCLDKSDEFWEDCGCRDGYFQCNAKGHCIPPSFVCDGSKDCPEGEDEAGCVAVRARRDDRPTSGDVVTNTCGLWHELCPPLDSDTEDELIPDKSALCQLMGHTATLGRTQRHSTSTGTVPQPELDVFSTVRLRKDLEFAVRADRPLVRLKRASCPVTVRFECRAK
ncbi:hypothetical protein B566_EDAN018310 [Ephemera danica]|nr:hypothetical protein B566_EDAN018310 [Ephemera danica]